MLGKISQAARDAALQEMMRASLDPKLTAAIGQLKKWGDDSRRTQRKAQQRPPVLYQYTGGAGLKGIIETHQVWLTNVFDMNDPSEFMHGIKYAAEYIMEVRQTGSLAVQAFCDWMLPILSPPFGDDFGMFVASFSDADDDLGQWRAYANNGRGYALGFSSKEFPEEESGDIIPGGVCALARVNYSKASFQDLQKEAIQKAVSILTETEKLLVDNLEAQRFHFLAALGFQLAVPIFWNSLTTKHEAYANEKEHRLVVLGTGLDFNNYIQTRLQGDRIVPYVAVPLTKGADHWLKSVRVRPAASAGAELGVDVLLRTSQIDHPNIVTRSTIPYRAL